VNILKAGECLHSCKVQTDAAGRWQVGIHRDGALQETHIIGAQIDSNALETSSLVPLHPPSLQQLFSPADNPAPSSSSPSSSSPASFFSSSSSSLLADSNLSHCGILVTGSDMRCFDRRMWDFVLAHGSMVFARTSPEQKLKIVSECQKRGEIVAVTGDGTNDAPALKRADVGVAMAAGAEVAQEASDMILLDNNFVSVVTAIETGRLVSDNLKKVTLYLLPAGSWSELLPILANFFLGLPLPLSAFLMIIICMLTDMCPSLALVKETPESDIMKRKPIVRSSSHLVNWRLLFHAYALIGMIESFSAFLCWFAYFESQGLPAHALFFAFDNYSDGYYGKTQAELDELQFTGQSIFFVSLVITQFANLLSSRTRYLSFFSHSPFHGPSRNLWLFAAMAVSSLIAVIITQVPFFNNTFHTRPVPVRYVAPALGFGAFLFLFDEARKLVARHHPQSAWAQLAW
jgi:sodium/potassium-transporting ATPase subunit alpha